MRILLAGATGAVGRALLPRLRAAGHTVIAMTRSAERARSLQAAGAEAVIADALDRATVFAALTAARPDAVIHQLTDLSARDFAANDRLRIAGTRHLVDAARAAGVERMVAQSLAFAYGPGNAPAREDEPLDTTAPAPRSETIAGVSALEAAVAELPYGVVLRYGLFYGPGAWYSRDGLVTEQFQRGELTATDAVSSFIHISDAAEAALQALEWPAGAVNIVDDEPAAASVWMPVYAALVGAPPPPVQPGRQPWERGASNAKARALGWVPAWPAWRSGFERELR